LSISHAESALHPVYRIRPSLCLRGALVFLPALSLLAAFYAGALPTAMRVALAVFTLFIAVVAARTTGRARPRRLRIFRYSPTGVVFSGSGMGRVVRA